MPALSVNQHKVTPQTAKQLTSLCPFSAISYSDGLLEINSGCKMCKLCIKKGPAGVITMSEESVGTSFAKDTWRGIAVFAECRSDKLHNVTLELIGKAKELASVIHHPVYVLLAGYNVRSLAEQLLYYGPDHIYLYDAPQLRHYLPELYVNILEDFIKNIRPSCVMIGATNAGRILAPRAAARFRAGLTADCTVLEMKENTDLVQIRPAFGGNIMARIVTPNHRPQFCTVRYKVFPSITPDDQPHGSITEIIPETHLLQSDTRILEVHPKAPALDITDSKIIVAVGRGIRKQSDLKLAQKLAHILNAQLACTRPLVENGWFDAKRQIGLSGRTVNADLVITVGISGSVQFTAGMRNSTCIIAINSDPNAPIFDIAHYGFVGDLYQLLPCLLELWECDIQTETQSLPEVETHLENVVKMEKEIELEHATIKGGL